MRSLALHLRRPAARGQSRRIEECALRVQRPGSTLRLRVELDPPATAPVRSTEMNDQQGDADGTGNRNLVVLVCRIAWMDRYEGGGSWRDGRGGRFVRAGARVGARGVQLPARLRRGLPWLRPSCEPEVRRGRGSTHQHRPTRRGPSTATASRSSENPGATSTGSTPTGPSPRRADHDANGRDPSTVRSRRKTSAVNSC